MDPLKGKNNIKHRHNNLPKSSQSFNLEWFNYLAILVTHKMLGSVEK